MKKFRTLLYYKYAKLEEAEVYAKRHLKYCKQLNLVGRIIVADEGINGTVSGTIQQTKTYMKHLEDDPHFEGIEFKEDLVDELSFNKMHVRYRPEVVTLGAKEVFPDNKAPHLSANEVLALKDQDDFVLLDVRNNIEHEVGKFKDAVTMDIDHFRDFTDNLKQIEHLKDKKVIAYCTGGIRCEKATTVMLQNGFEQVYQIDGGIIKYGKETGGKDFDGKCYVFDKRIMVDVNSVNPTVISLCRICDKETSHMVNCSNPECNEHFCICEECGWEMQGACSAECKEHPRARTYDGSGYYSR